MSNSEASFLDLPTIIEKNKFKDNLFGKRDVLQMPHLSSNNPENIYFASIGSEILRFPKTTFDSNTC